MSTWDEAAVVEAIYQAITRHTFAPHELPLDARLRGIYRDNASGVVAALAPHLAARDAAVWAQACEAAARRCDRLRVWGDDFIGTGNSRAWARAAESLAVQIRALALTQSEGPPE